MRLSLLLFFLLFSKVSFCQKCGIIVDIKTKNGIPYTTIASSNKQKGVLADEKGKFCLTLAISQNDSIVVSALGYKIKTLSISEYLKSDTIYLQEKNISLSEVIVNPKKRKSKLIGYFHKNIIIVGSGRCMNSSATLATRIDNIKNGEKLLTKLHYRLSPHKSTFVKKFRLSCSVYNNGANNLPERNLLERNVIIDVSPTDRYAEVHVDTMDVFFNQNSIWIGIQTLGYINYDNEYITISNHEYGKVVYQKNNPNKVKEIYLISPYFEMSKGNDYATKYVGSKSWNRTGGNSKAALFCATFEY